ncbi:MAG: hypothetical protein ACYDHD_01635 [Vulcanimicrobiaceae bacterium]
MSTIQDFRATIGAADQLLAMYAELRKSRKLGARGALPQTEQDLLWLPRAAVVVALSTMDAYIHAVLYERIPIALKSSIIPEALAVAMADQLTIKNGAGFASAYPIIASQNPETRLLDKLYDSRLQFESYQQPDKIIQAYSLMGIA